MPGSATFCKCHTLLRHLTQPVSSRSFFPGPKQTEFLYGYVSHFLALFNSKPLAPIARHQFQTVNLPPPHLLALRRQGIAFAAVPLPSPSRSILSFQRAKAPYSVRGQCALAAADGFHFLHHAVAVQRLAQRQQNVVVDSVKGIYFCSSFSIFFRSLYRTTIYRVSVYYHAIYRGQGNFVEKCPKETVEITY
jgi:hypothetical protein